MSESFNQGDGNGNHRDSGSLQGSGYDTSLLSDCDELVGLIAKSNSPEGPYNSVEVRAGSEADFADAYLQQTELINRLECLAEQITGRAAATEVELEAKIRALDELAGVASWERDSLRALRRSVDRDRAEVTKTLNLPLVSHSRLGWISRCFGLSPRFAG